MKARKIFGVTAGLVMMVLAVMPVGLVTAESLVASRDEFFKVCETLKGNDSETKLLRQQAGCDEVRTAPNMMISLFNFGIAAVGLSAVFAIVFGGQRMVTGSEDVAKVKQARVAIMYGVVGIVVAMLAFVIVHFVKDKLGK